MFTDLRADLDRFIETPGYAKKPLLKLRSLFEAQGVWAVCVYRFGRWVYKRPSSLRRWPFEATYLVAHKLMQMTAGIDVPE